MSLFLGAYYHNDGVMEIENSQTLLGENQKSLPMYLKFAEKIYKSKPILKFKIGKKMIKIHNYKLCLHICKKAKKEPHFLSLSLNDKNAF